MKKQESKNPGTTQVRVGWMNLYVHNVHSKFSRITHIADSRAVCRMDMGCLVFEAENRIPVWCSSCVSAWLWRSNGSPALLSRLRGMRDLPDKDSAEAWPGPSFADLKSGGLPWKLLQGLLEVNIYDSEFSVKLLEVVSLRHRVPKDVTLDQEQR